MWSDSAESPIGSTASSAPPRRMLSLRAPRGRPRIVGHRGALGHAPENTMASFARAVDLGVDVIEFDVHLSRDGEIVVIHDPELDRTTNGHGPVRDQTLSELKQLDAGSYFGAEFAGERIPTLDEVLEWARPRLAVDIEIKNAPLPYAGIEEAVIAALERQDMLDKAVVISFDHPTVKRTKERCPELATGVLYACRPLDALALARAADADALMPHWSYVQALDVQRAHQADLTVHPWVTSDPAIIRRLLAFDVDSIASNHPDVVRTALGRVEPAG